MLSFWMFLTGFALFLIGSSLFVGAGLLWFFSEKRAYREPRTILCPENGEYATVSVDGARAARTMFDGHEEFPISACSRWPGRIGCDQACSVQVPLVADDRTRGQYAPFGLTPAQLRINSPVRMTAHTLAKLKGTP